MWYFEEGGVVLWRMWCGALKRVMWYFEECDVVLWRVCVMFYFEEGGVLLLRGLVVLWRWRWTLVWISHSHCLYDAVTGNAIEKRQLWRGWCVTLKRVVLYFNKGGVLFWRGWCVIFRWFSYWKTILVMLSRKGSLMLKIRNLQKHFSMSYMLIYINYGELLGVCPIMLIYINYGVLLVKRQLIFRNWSF